VNRSLLAAAVACLLAACGGGGGSSENTDTGIGTPGGQGFNTTQVAQFDEPWAMTFLPDGALLVTEKRGELVLFADGAKVAVTGVPAVAYGGQGGLGDVVLHPEFASNNLVYLSYVEAGEGGTSGSAVARGKLIREPNGARLTDVNVIWRQEPKMSGSGHFSQRLAFGADGLLWITSGDRQEFTPAQDMQMNLGKVLRLKDDGSVPADNPFAGQGGVAAQVWSLGHRNPLGIAFDDRGGLWTHEMGPRGGDELNLIERGANYGWPLVSNGDHYDGRSIPDHDTQSQFNAPKIAWNPVISPAGLIFYNGREFPEWSGNAFMGGLSSQALIRLEFTGSEVREAERFKMGARIREVEQGPEGAIWVLEDGRGAALLKLTAKR
jgi:aldose sugar dehydrogenase